MHNLLLELSEFTPASVAVRIILSALFGGLIGIERSKTGHDAGLRTHIFIALGSTMTALVGLYVATTFNAALDPLRISAQVVSGIGFLGAGTILVKNSSRVTGLTTAAGMWATATIGLAVGFGFYLGAVLCTIICIITAAVLSMLEGNRKDVIQLYVEVEGPEHVNETIDKVSEMFLLHNVFTVTAKSNMAGHIGIIATVSLEGTLKQDVIVKTLALPGVVMAVQE